MADLTFSSARSANTTGDFRRTDVFGATRDPDGSPVDIGVTGQQVRDFMASQLRRLESYSLAGASDRLEWYTPDFPGRGPCLIDTRASNEGHNIGMMYNMYISGVLLSPADDYASNIKLETNWFDGNDYVMESYMEFRKRNGDISRPFFCKYNKLPNQAGRIKSTGIDGSETAGTSFSDDVYRRSNPGAHTHRLRRNDISIYGVNNDHSYIRLESGGTTRSSIIDFFVGTDKIDTLQTSGRIMAHIVSSADRQISITPGILGSGVSVRSLDAYGVSTVGINGNNNSAALKIHGENLPHNFPSLKIIGNNSATRPLIELDGIQKRAFSIYKEGYIAVREIGQTRDRIPTLASGSYITLDTNWQMPDGLTLASTSPDKWLPMLDENGSLGFVPWFSAT